MLCRGQFLASLLPKQIRPPCWVFLPRGGWDHYIINHMFKLDISLQLLHNRNPHKNGALKRRNPSIPQISYVMSVHVDITYYLAM